jgi:hypothetical protein
MNVFCRAEAEAAAKQRDELEARCTELQTQMREQKVGFSCSG